MSTISKNTLILLPAFLILLFSCTDEEVIPQEGTPGTSAPYTVTGTIIDTKGNPVAGAKVRADNDALYGSAEVTTDANGKYTLPKLEIGGWKIYAWKEVSYKGKIYHLRMGMPNDSDYNAFSPGEKGAIKNFQWQLSGIIPDRPRSNKSPSGYFGGSLSFINMDPDANSIPKNTDITITLTPIAGAALFDGSTPQTIQKSFTIEGGNEFNYWIHDIPQCEYRITAESNLNGIKKIVLLSDNFYEGHSPAIESFYFKPDILSSGSYENGLLTPADNPFYMKLN